MNKYTKVHSIIQYQVFINHPNKNIVSSFQFLLIIVKSEEK